MNSTHIEKQENESLRFIFTTCQVGAEPSLKKELLREHPELKFAFSRPGFLTFKKSEGDLALDFNLNSIFARTFGISFERIKLSDIPPHLGSSAALIIERARVFLSKHTFTQLRLHVWEKDTYPSGEEPLGYCRGILSGALENQLRKEAPDLFYSETKASVDDLVLDLIFLDSETLWLGAHLHSAFHSAFPGGCPSVPLPDASPSRAYLKLQEVALWSGAPLREGQMAVEIGSAPGGASFALLERGLKVVGIDPAEMSPVVFSHPGFKHFRCPVASVLREELPESIQWLLLDMNVEPRISLFAVDRLASRMKDSLLGILLTIKLNQWEISDQLPSILDHVKAMGMVKVRAAQLFSHRREIVIYGLTRRGLALLRKTG